MSATYRPLRPIKAESDVVPLPWKLAVEREERTRALFRCTETIPLYRNGSKISAAFYRLCSILQLWG